MLPFLSVACLLFMITCSYLMYEVFSLIFAEVFALQTFSSSCLCLFGPLAFISFSSSSDCLILGCPFRCERLLEALGGRLSCFLWVHSQLFRLCCFIRELPKSVWIGLVSCSDWMSQRSFPNFLPEVTCLLSVIWMPRGRRSITFSTLGS